MIWTFHDPRMTPERLGLIPLFLSENDPRPAAEQFNENYAHGGGWRPFSGFVLKADRSSIQYADDPCLMVLASAQLRDETILYYDSAWVMILQKDGTHEIARMD